VRFSVAGFMASAAAISAISSPAESVNMCPASASSARLPVSTEPIISAIITAKVMAKTMISLPRLPAASPPGE
jgi:hypothetical protein